MTYMYIPVNRTISACDIDDYGNFYGKECFLYSAVLENQLLV